MSPMAIPKKKEGRVNMLVFIWEFKMSNYNSPVTKLNDKVRYTSKFLTKHHIGKWKYSKTYCHYHAITLCHVQVMKYIWLLI